LLFQEPEVDATGISGLTTLREGVPAAVGAALEYLWPTAQGNDLLSRGVRSRAKVPLMVTMVLGALILIALAVYVVAPISIEEDRLKEIDRQIALRKDEVRAVEKIKKEIEDVNREMALVARFKSEHPPAIALMRELTSIVPKNAWLTRVRIAGTQINVEGYSPSASSLIQIFEASKYFQKVEFSSPTFRDARLNMDRFQLKMELKAAPAEAPGNEKK
jgi:general secretion pathway protein L